MLLYDLSQNSGKPLQGTVFFGCVELLVLVLFLVLCEEEVVVLRSPPMIVIVGFMVDVVDLPVDFLVVNGSALPELDDSTVFCPLRVA